MPTIGKSTARLRVHRCLSKASSKDADRNKAGEVWAIALSRDGQYLASTSFDGRVNVWDDLANGAKLREFETKGSFGMCIALVGRYVRIKTNLTASLPMLD